MKRPPLLFPSAEDQAEDQTLNPGFQNCYAPLQMNLIWMHA